METILKDVLAVIWDSEKRERVPVNGKFHQWGLSYKESSRGITSYTVAIIELENGKIVTSLPEDVIF